MGIFTRIWLAFYAICLSVLSFAVMVVSLWPVVYDRISDYFKSSILQNRYMSFGAFIAAFILFVVSIVFLTTGMRNNKDKKAVVKRTSIGDIRISLETMENLALTAAKRFNGVKETKAWISRNRKEDSISVVLKMSVMPEMNLPSLSEDIQRKVKKLIEENAGVAVKSVRVSVDNIYTGYRSRVE